MSYNPFDDPKFKEEEDRLERLRLRVVDLLGCSYDQAYDIVRTGVSEEEILKQISNYRGISSSLPNEVVKIVIGRIEEKLLEKSCPSTGYVSLDEKIKGFLPGHLYTLTGGTNVGKTAIASNFACRMGKMGNRRILYFALEPDNVIVDYLASCATGVRYDDISALEYGEIPPSIEIYTKDQITSLSAMVEAVRGLRRYDLVIVDHIGYFIKGQQNTNQQQSDAIKTLAGLAKEKQCAILIIAHLNKAAKDIPTMNDISGSGAFKQDSTEVLIVVRNTVEDDEFKLSYTDQGYILVAKTKSGKPGAVPVKFHDGSALVTEELTNYQIMKQAIQQPLSH